MSKIAIVVSHPIQHFCPQYASIAAIAGIELKVFFGSSIGAEKYFDANFGKEISWGNLSLESFDHEFVNGKQPLPVDRQLDCPDLDERLTEFSPDMVIVYGYTQKMSRRAVNWAKSNRKASGYISDTELNGGRPGYVKSLIRSFYLRWYFRKIGYFLWVGNSNRKFYLSCGVPEKKLLRMHFPIDIRHYKDCKTEKSVLRDEKRAELSVGNGEIVVLVVGKLVHWKSQDHLVELAYAFERLDRSITVVIAGSGDMEAELKEKVKGLVHSKVIFPGFVTPEELPSFYAAADIYIHPAEFEPHSLAISEAIYMGLPVIVSDRCGSYGWDDDVRPGENGLVYPYGNIGKLTDCVLELTDQKGKLSAFGQRSSEIGDALQQISHHKCWLSLLKIIGG